MTAHISDADARVIAARFSVNGVIVEARPHGGGHINSSWCVTARSDTVVTRYFLQRINGSVFPDPVPLVDNAVNVLQHLAGLLEAEQAADRWRRVLTVVLARDGFPFIRDESGDVWRMFLFIEDAMSVAGVVSPDRAYDAAFAFGDFQRRMSSYRGPPIRDTIAGFHDTPARLAAFERAITTASAARKAAARSVIENALRHRAVAHSLHEIGGAPLPSRVVHNDAKLENVLFDARTRGVLCIVDLDTVMRGVSVHDFGDIARTMATNASEDGGDAAVEIDLPLFKALASGFIDGTGGLLNSVERSLLVTGVQVITYEQALRFLTDYLEGDRYYRISRPGQNLDRALAQLAIVGEFTRNERSLRKLIP